MRDSEGKRERAREGRRGEVKVRTRVKEGQEREGNRIGT